MPTALWLTAALTSRTRRPHARPARPARRNRRVDAGEGVISTAIAILIVASVGALMWVGFQRLWERTEARTGEQVERIGS
jgi:ABC-type transport system involved in cytochrome c biogenesis permease subunit